MTKRLLTTILLLTCIAVSTLAQQGLRVADIFSRYGDERGCKMVEMHDTELRGYKLKTSVKQAVWLGLSIYHVVFPNSTGRW